MVQIARNGLAMLENLQEPVRQNLYEHIQIEDIYEFGSSSWLFWILHCRTYTVEPALQNLPYCQKGFERLTLDI